jgi:hypothetical protein
MKIVPLGITDNSKGQPVDVLGIVGGNGKWDIKIRCEGDIPHILSLDKGLLILHDHTPDEIQEHENLARLGSTPEDDNLDAISPCVKIKAWLRGCGLTIIEDVMP